MLNLDYLNSRKIILPAYDTITLVLVGCGGTGSFMARNVAVTGRLLMEKFQKEVDIFFIDPDRVEAKNVYRQNFCEAEIGHGKAATLAHRFSLAWGMDIRAVPDKFNVSQLSYGRRLTVLIGCVDGPEGRKAIREAARVYENVLSVWWLDCGNHQAAGQVLIGCGANRPKDPFGLPGLCSWLPLPTDLHPELLTNEIDAEAGPTAQADLSCADLAMLDSQGLAINQKIAAEAGDYLFRLLLTRDLRKRASYIDLASGTTRSLYITED